MSCNDHEADHRIDHEADADERIAEVEPDRPEVGLAEDRSDDRVQHTFEQRIDDRLEVQRHDQADGDLDDVALGDEVLEFLKH